MNNEAKLETVAALSFILAGNATFTFRSIATGTRYTYKVRADQNKPNIFWVKYLFGQDNDRDYKYMGMIVDNKFRLTQKSLQTGLTEETGPVKAFAWVFAKLVAAVEPPSVEIWHAGTCGRCGRTLTVPESISMGLGPECASKGF